MGQVAADDIQVLVFDEFSNSKLIGTRSSLLLHAYQAQYSWSSASCPEGYGALGNALFVKVLIGMSGRPQPIPQPETADVTLHVSPNGATRWNFQPWGDEDFGIRPVLCAMVFPLGCGADDFNFIHFGVKELDGRLAIIFLLPPSKMIQVRWRTYTTELPIGHQIERLYAVSDQRDGEWGLMSGRFRKEEKNPPVAKEIETILLAG
jgi:hypothetical protein